MGPYDQAIFERCRARHGLVTLAELHAIGLGPSSVRRRVASGWLVPVQSGVFRLGASPPAWRQELAAAVLAGGEPALAARRSAAALWELEGARGSRLELVVPRWLRRHVRAATVIESLDLRRGDAARVDGIPVTDVPRTLIDCASKVHPDALARLSDDAVRRRLTTYDAVLDRFVRLARRGRPGVVRMRNLLEARVGVHLDGTNTFERLVVDIVGRAGLPAPEPQLPVDLGGHRFYLDLAWPARRVCVECDGFDTHGTPSALRGDLERQNLLILDGWTVLRFAWRTVVDTPDLVATQLSSVLRTPPP